MRETVHKDDRMENIQRPTCSKWIAFFIAAVTVQVADTFGVSAQNLSDRRITGKVLSLSSRQPLPGVSIYQKGTSQGTFSDAEGNYSLNISDPATLVFSSVGFLTQEVQVGSRQVIDISLEEDITALEEVVIIGYGEQKRSNVSGAVSSINVDEIENKTQLRLDQALQGMAAGVTVTRNGGAPGSSPTIHIRGVGSIGNTEPLWIIDGIRMEPGNHFDVDDVASIEILKDAAASAIYGAKAAHGVILVTTKRGKGDTKITFKSSVGKRAPLNLPTLLNSADFVKYKKQSRQNAGQNPEPSWDQYEHDTDWIDAYYDGSGVLQSYDLSIMKGDEKLNFFMSFGHDDEEGILIDNSYKRYSARINSDIKLTNWLKLGESVLLSRVKENPIGNNNESYTGSIPFRSIPIMPVYDENNPYGGWGRAPVYFQGPNPVATQYQQHESRIYNRLNGNVYLEATPLKDLLLRATVGFNYSSFLGEKFDEAFDYGAFANPINMLTYSAANDQSVIANMVATYTKVLDKNHLKVMAGYEASSYDPVHFNVSRTMFPIDRSRSFNLGTGPYASTDPFNVNDPGRMLSQFGRLNYNYDEKYLVEANIRRDASAPKFGPANLWGIFPSFSAAWRISRESFFKDIPYITNLKLRASAGKLGSDNIGNYIYLKTYTSQFSTYSFDRDGTNKVSGFYIGKFPNEEVKWEEVNMRNVALDLAAFESKFTFSIDYYIRDTKDLLYGVPIPASVGIATHNFDPVNPQINIGTLRNTGLDIELGYKTSVNKFNFNITGNTSFLKNEILSLIGDEYIMGGNGGGQIGGMTRTQAGMPMSSFYGFVVRRILNTQAEVNAINTWADDGIYQEAGTAPGDLMYWDLSGPEGVPDGEVTAEYDRTFIGNPWPEMTFALNMSADYNGMFDISLQFQGVQGVDVFNADKAYTRNFFGDNNTTTRIYQAWTPEKFTAHPRNIASDPNGNFGRPSSYFVEDGSYLKLRNIQVGFTLPSRNLDRIGLTRLRLYVNANNLLTFTKYSGLDPEIAGSNTSRGVDYGLYPQVRTVSAGIEVQF